MKRYITIVSWIILILLFYPAGGQCLDVDVRGRVSSLFILRDTDGFQSGFMDHAEGSQWRNELKFDLTLKPEYEGTPFCYLEKVFLSYRGAYDAIFALRDDYDHIREKSTDDFELGRDDIEWENDLREAFVDLVAESGMQKVNLRLGRQIDRWGETDSFNVINVVNPNDNSYQMFFSNPDDLATPLWMARLDYTVVGVSIFDSLGLELLAIPDSEPMITAPLGGEDGFANADAPYAFAFKSFLEPVPGVPVTMIHEDTAADNWDNMEYAISLSFGIRDLQAALHYFVGYQDQGAMDWGNYNLWVAPLSFGFPVGSFGGSPDLTWRHPRQRTYGFSFNYFVAPLNGVIRGEGALTDKMYMMETPAPSNNYDLTMIEDAKVYQLLLGFDKDLHPNWIGTRSALTWMAETYWKHIADWKTDKTLHPANKEDTCILTCTLLTDYHHGMIKPFVMAMYDTEGTWMTRVSLAYDPDSKWLFEIAQMSFWGNREAISDFSYGGALINTSELSFKVSYRF